MSRVASFVLCVSVCGCVHDRPSVSIAASPSASTIDTPVATATSGPRIQVETDGSYESWAPSWDGLPAISPDGKSVAYAYQLDDGGRGFPSLYLGVLPIGGEHEQTTTIFTAEEISQSSPALPRLVQQRVADANTRLRGWSPMETGDLEWTYSEPKLVVRDHGREVFARTLEGGPASDDHCAYTAQLRVRATDPKRRVLFVGLQYSAPPDFCPNTDVFRAFSY